MSNVTIKDDWLTWDNDQEVELTGQNVKGWQAKITPKVIVIHYGVTHTQKALIAAQRARGYWAHLSIDGGHNEGGVYYQVHQALPFTARGSHAGESSYKGEEGVNGFSIGIEIANPGPIVDGKTVYGKTWPEEDTMQARHAIGFPRNWLNWATYTDQEIDILITVCKALIKEYPTIVDIVGHDDISPGRKFDPGPAFPMTWLREQLFGTTDKAEDRA